MFVVSYLQILPMLEQNSLTEIKRYSITKRRGNVNEDSISLRRQFLQSVFFLIRKNVCMHSVLQCVALQFKVKLNCTQKEIFFLENSFSSSIMFKFIDFNVDNKHNKEMESFGFFSAKSKLNIAKKKSKYLLKRKTMSRRKSLYNFVLFC